MNIENLVYKMLLENTGIHMLDSGGANGRLWQRNQHKTLEDFKKEPECTLTVSQYINKNDGVISYDTEISLSLFHHLTKILTLDKLCNQFNRQKMIDWDGDYYGTDEKHTKFINDRFKVEEQWYSYNWGASFSQDVQGHRLTHLDNDDVYYLLQIHGGADARGGFTDAKLFKLYNTYDDYLMNEQCTFYIDIDNENQLFIDYIGGDFSDKYGNSIDDDSLAKWFKHAPSQPITGYLLD